MDGEKKYPDQALLEALQASLYQKMLLKFPNKDPSPKSLGRPLINDYTCTLQ